jgi:hypothetical protein
MDKQHQHTAEYLAYLKNPQPVTHRVGWLEALMLSLGCSIGWDGRTAGESYVEQRSRNRDAIGMKTCSFPLWEGPG